MYQHKYTYIVVCVHVFLINWSCRALGKGWSSTEGADLIGYPQENKMNCNPDRTWHTHHFQVDYKCDCER